MRTRLVIALLLAIPLADALFLVFVAGAVGWQITVALVVLTALVGTLLVRAEGRHTLRKIQRRLNHGEIPTDELFDGALLIAAGAFLLTPGLVTDTIGFLLAIPLSRYPIRETLKRGLVKPYLDRKTGGFVSGGVWTAGFPGPDDGADVGDRVGFGSTADDADHAFGGGATFDANGTQFGGDPPGFGDSTAEFDGDSAGTSDDGATDAYDVDPDEYRFEDDTDPRR